MRSKYSCLSYRTVGGHAFFSEIRDKIRVSECGMSVLIQCIGHGSIGVDVGFPRLVLSL